MMQDRVLEQLLERTIQRQTQVICVEQQVLTEVTYGRALSLSNEYNWQTWIPIFTQVCGAEGMNKDVANAGAELFQNPAISTLPAVPDNVLIYHYDGQLKPWTFKSIGPYTEEWYRYLRLTPFWGIAESIREEISCQISRVSNSSRLCIGVCIGGIIELLQT
jgi:lipopolysaccharide biosynthesis glycosyltransferase